MENCISIGYHDKNLVHKIYQEFQVNKKDTQ